MFDFDGLRVGQEVWHRCGARGTVVSLRSGVPYPIHVEWHTTLVSAIGQKYRTEYYSRAGQSFPTGKIDLLLTQPDRVDLLQVANGERVWHVTGVPGTVVRLHTTGATYSVVGVAFTRTVQIHSMKKKYATFSSDGRWMPSDTPEVCLYNPIDKEDNMTDLRMVNVGDVVWHCSGVRGRVKWVRSGKYPIIVEWETRVHGDGYNRYSATGLADTEHDTTPTVVVCRPDTIDLSYIKDWETVWHEDGTRGIIMRDDEAYGYPYVITFEKAVLCGTAFVTKQACFDKTGRWYPAHSPLIHLVNPKEAAGTSIPCTSASNTPDKDTKPNQASRLNSGKPRLSLLPPEVYRMQGFHLAPVNSVERTRLALSNLTLAKRHGIGVVGQLVIVKDIYDALQELAKTMPGYDEYPEAEWINLALTAAMDFGCRKYARDDYRRGFPFTELIDAALRHLAKIGKEHIDPESGAPHIGAAAFNVMCLYRQIVDYENYKRFDDRSTED